VKEQHTLLTMPAVLEYLRAHRAGADVPGEYLSNLGERDRLRVASARGLSQSLVATMAGVDVRTYGDYERRGLASGAVVRAVAGILGASRAQQVAMWRWARRPVPPELRPPTGPVDPDLADQLTGATHAPVVWLTPEWDVLGANEPAALHLGPLARPGANWAASSLGPYGEARQLITDWPACARWMVEMLRMAIVDPQHSPRAAEVACEVRQYQPTAQMWDACADMREDPDGMALQASLPGLSPHPVDLRLSTLARGDIRLIVLRPIVSVRRVDRTEASRALPSAQWLADAVVELGATVCAVNYRSPCPEPHPPSLHPFRAGEGTSSMDVSLRRAAIATEAAYKVAPAFLRNGAPIPRLPASTAIAQHLSGQVVCSSREEVEAAVGGRPDLIAALIPDPPPGADGARIGRMARVPLAVPDPNARGGVRILGSVVAYRTENRTPFTAEELAQLRHLADVRSAAMTRETQATRDAWGKTA
jgi:MmyB-like transcription regulator ligand binding domain